MSTSVPDVLCEHAALVRMLASVQERVTCMARTHAQELAQLQKEIFLLRAQLVIRDTALQISKGRWLSHESCTEDLQPFLEAADWVICRTGCISQGDYWREQGMCRRTGKTCVLVELDIPSPVSAHAEVEETDQAGLFSTPAARA